MRRILTAIALVLIPSLGWAQEGSTPVTPGSGLNLGAWVAGGKNYPENVITDPTTPTNHLSINVSGQAAVLAAQSGSWSMAATQSGTWTITLGASGAKAGIFTTDQTTPGTTDLVHAAQQGSWTVAVTGVSTAANQATQITEETLTANAMGTPGDTAYTGTGTATTISALKGIYNAAVSPILNFPTSVDVNSGPTTANTIRVVQATNPLTPTQADSATSLVLKNSPGTLFYAEATNYSTTTSGFLIAYNATAAPSTGAITASLVLGCAPLGAGSKSTITFPYPATFSVGITLLLSSGSTCANYTTGTITGKILGQNS